MRTTIPTVLLLTASLASQVRWETHVDLAARTGHAMAYDAARQRVLLFGGGISRNDLWEWDGAAWTLRSALRGPPGRVGHGMAFDAARGRLVVFGGTGFDGSNLGELDDTWEWDGSNWLQAAPTRSPSMRSGASMVFDSARGRVVLFGGLHIANYQGTFYDDLWEWDGNDWTALPATVRPPARTEAALAFDPVRTRLVMFGGWTGGSVGRVDTWEWNGSTWTERTPAGGPILDRGAAATFAPTSGGTLLLGQTTPFLQLPRMETWLFDGTNWTLVSGGPSPITSGGFVVLTHDPSRGRTVSFGAGVGGETWEFDGARWSNALPGITPAFRSQSLVFDSVRGIPVIVGNSSAGYVVETWERNGAAWIRRTGVGGPAISIGQAMAFDAARARTVLFGGQSPYGNDQHWEYDGTTWSQRMPSPRPPWLYGHAMAFDPLRQRIVLFGTSSTSALGVTWEWDGASWTQQSPAHVPWGRRFAGIAWHPGRQRVLLYGGEGSSTSSLYADFWEWDGTDWTQLATRIPPGERARHQMVYDSVRDRLVVHGGSDTVGTRTDTWEWDGQTWVQRSTAANPGPTRDFTMTFDEARGETLLFGGFPYQTWTYAAEVTARTRAFGIGCAGSAGVPVLAPDAGSRPWLGDHFRQVASNLPANSTAVFKFGVSDRFWFGLPLPFDLSIIGMNGCTEYTSSDVVVGVPTGLGVAAFDFTLPSSSSLRGARLFTQVFTLDPLANPFGATTTNAIEAIAGSR